VFGVDGGPVDRAAPGGALLRIGAAVAGDPRDGNGGLPVVAIQLSRKKSNIRWWQPADSERGIGGTRKCETPTWPATVT
jgi:hypothetical protein